MSTPTRKLWTYWHDGEGSAPFLVRQCLQSWRRMNPDWPLVVLDDSTFRERVDLGGLERRHDIALQALTDILRVKLLLQEGGVWVDATLYCQRSLDEWLPPYIDDEFFAFASRKRDRLMTTWFLYGTGGSRILNAWADEIVGYWSHHRFRPGGYARKQIVRKLTSLRKRKLLSNDVWFSSFVTTLLGTYPYPVNMYLFERCLARHADVASLWKRRRHLYDTPAERIQYEFGMSAASS